jgi:hypothetical protein
MRKAGAANRGEHGRKSPAKILACRLARDKTRQSYICSMSRRVLRANGRHQAEREKRRAMSRTASMLGRGGGDMAKAASLDSGVGGFHADYGLAP